MSAQVGIPVAYFCALFRHRHRLNPRVPPASRTLLLAASTPPGQPRAASRRRAAVVDAARDGLVALDVLAQRKRAGALRFLVDEYAPGAYLGPAAEALLRVGFACGACASPRRAAVAALAALAAVAGPCRDAAAPHYDGGDAAVARAALAALPLLFVGVLAAGDGGAPPGAAHAILALALVEEANPGVLAPPPRGDDVLLGEGGLPVDDDRRRRDVAAHVDLDPVLAPATDGAVPEPAAAAGRRAARLMAVPPMSLAACQRSRSQSFPGVSWTTTEQGPRLPRTSQVAETRGSRVSDAAACAAASAASWATSASFTDQLVPRAARAAATTRRSSIVDARVFGSQKKIKAQQPIVREVKCAAAYRVGGPNSAAYRGGRSRQSLRAHPVPCPYGNFLLNIC